jgi:preprotein translocase subunit Sss1
MFCYVYVTRLLTMGGKHVELYSKNKFEKLVHLVGFIIRLYHDARSSECQIWETSASCWFYCKTYITMHGSLNVKFEKLVHLVGFIIKIYHDARSSECQIWEISASCWFYCKTYITMHGSLKVKFEKLVHLVGFIIRIYHDARSSECQISQNTSVIHQRLNKFKLVTNQMLKRCPLGFTFRISGPRNNNIINVVSTSNFLWPNTRFSKILLNERKFSVIVLKKT